MGTSRSRAVRVAEPEDTPKIGEVKNGGDKRRGRVTSSDL